MRRSVSFWAILALLLMPIHGLWADFGDIYDMPVAEAEDVISGWLDANGFKIYRPSPEGDATVLLADKGSQQLRIVTRQSSPLAVRIAIEPSPGAAESAAHRLRQYLLGYIQLPNRPVLPVQPSIPDAVRSVGDAVACIYAIHQGREIQLTGFAVDLRGMIVCTGHDLVLEDDVDLLLRDGREMAGRVVKIDRERDLALIRIPQDLQTVVTLRDGRFMLSHEDSLFAVMCADNGLAAIEHGYLDGPPRRVAGMTLWQVRMRIEPGSSGSPVFDRQGRLTGIVKGRYRGTDTVGFLIPFESLLQFLEIY